MSWSYEKLKHLLISKHIKQSQLIRMIGAGPNVSAKISKNEPLNMATIGKICEALHCGIEDILEWIHEDDDSTSSNNDNEGNDR